MTTLPGTGTWTHRCSSEVPSEFDLPPLHGSGEKYRLEYM
jgi:hypothetical protein